MGPMTGGMRGWCPGFMPAPWSFGARWPYFGPPVPFQGAPVGMQGAPVGMQGAPVPFQGGFPGYTPYPYAMAAQPWSAASISAPVWRPGFFPTFQPYGMSKDQEISYLENQAKVFEDQLEQIRNKLKELTSSE